MPAFAALGLLAACSGGASLNPVDWWHSLEGGPIAAARPPPPNADAPYPNFAAMPTGRPANDAAARGQIANALIADRANAQYDASITPIAPAAPKPVPPAPADANTSSGTFAAASAPPPPPPPRPVPAPRTAVQSAPLAPPPVAPPPLAPPAAGPGSSTAAAALPEMPAQPPAPASLPGVKQATMPTPPAPTPPPPVAAAGPPTAGAPISISFVPGRAVLPTTAYAPLTTLAQQRGAGSIAVVGFGGATDTAPTAQQAALPLALARARSIAAYLETAGVPAAAIRIDAEADGQGGVARLIR